LVAAICGEAILPLSKLHTSARESDKNSNTFAVAPG
jgi:hypothetical protein